MCLRNLEKSTLYWGGNLPPQQQAQQSTSSAISTPTTKTTTSNAGSPSTPAAASTPTVNAKDVPSRPRTPTSLLESIDKDSLGDALALVPPRPSFPASDSVSSPPTFSSPRTSLSGASGMTEVRNSTPDSPPLTPRALAMLDDDDDDDDLPFGLANSSTSIHSRHSAHTPRSRRQQLSTGLDLTHAPTLSRDSQSTMPISPLSSCSGIRRKNSLSSSHQKPPFPPSRMGSSSSTVSDSSTSSPRAHRVSSSISLSRPTSSSVTPHGSLRSQLSSRQLSSILSSLPSVAENRVLGGASSDDSAKCDSHVEELAFGAYESDSDSDVPAIGHLDPNSMNGVFQPKRSSLDASTQTERIHHEDDDVVDLQGEVTSPVRPIAAKVPNFSEDPDLCGTEPLVEADSKSDQASKSHSRSASSRHARPSTSSTRGSTRSHSLSRRGGSLKHSPSVSLSNHSRSYQSASLSSVSSGYSTSSSVAANGPIETSASFLDTLSAGTMGSPPLIDPLMMSTGSLDSEFSIFPFGGTRNYDDRRKCVSPRSKSHGHHRSRQKDSSHRSRPRTPRSASPTRSIRRHRTRKQRSESDANGDVASRHGLLSPQHEGDRAPTSPVSAPVAASAAPPRSPSFWGRWLGGLTRAITAHLEP